MHVWPHNAGHRHVPLAVPIYPSLHVGWVFRVSCVDLVGRVKHTSYFHGLMPVSPYAVIGQYAESLGKLPSLRGDDPTEVERWVRGVAPAVPGHKRIEIRSLCRGCRFTATTTAATRRSGADRVRAQVQSDSARNISRRSHRRRSHSPGRLSWPNLITRRNSNTWVMARVSCTRCR